MLWEMRSTNLYLRPPSNNQAQLSDDIYAKVLEKQAENGKFYIYFTAVPPDVEARLAQLYKTATK